MNHSDSSGTPRTIKLADYAPSPYLISHVDMDVWLDPNRTRVRTVLQIRPNPAAPAQGAPLVLDGETIELTAIALDGEALAKGAYRCDTTSLTIADVPEGPFRLEIENLCNPAANTALSGLYLSNGIYCTQCEAEGFRRITYFLDRPDVLATYRVRLEAPANAAPVLLANGNLTEIGGSEDMVHYAIWDDPHPKPSYLFAMVAGDLASVEDRFTTMSGRNVVLRIFVEHGKTDRCDYAMDALKRAMAWDEQMFGREYDLDIFMIVAVSDFNMGAMENKGLNIFNDKYILVRPDTATDTDYAHVEGIIAHEYFHNWTGNRITCRDWFQLCLKEGLTVFRDQQFTADQRSAAVKRIEDVRLLRSHQFPEDAGPLAHAVRPDSYIEINNFYTATVYEKGAEIVRMLHRLLGPAGFRKGMDLYFTRHDGEAATVEDFIACFAETAGRDLTQFMLWYQQAGTPELTVSGRYLPGADIFELTAVQSTGPTPGQPDKKPLPIPLALGLIDKDGRDLPLVLEDGTRIENGLIELTETSQSFRFAGLEQAPVPSLLRGFSAPVHLTAGLSNADRTHLMAHDSDLFNRWQVAQDYALQILKRNTAALRSGMSPRKGMRLAEAMLATLTDEKLEPAYRALFITLPGETDIAREIGTDVDPGAIHEAHEHLRAALGAAMRSGLETVYESLADRGPYSPDAAASGRRALRNAALGLLATSGAAADIARLEAHYREAANMTDMVAALGAAAHMDIPQRLLLFDDFYSRWHADHLVMDKWFALQATSSLPETLETVEALTRHELFSPTNPNRVRAVIGAFTAANPVNFHRLDGRGYDFAARWILQLDRINAQVAARMTGAFRNWRMLEPERRELARTALSSIANHEGLSRDVYEIATKSLA
ncbi:MAG: aminopeptidase N [Hyphomicrobiales bacterium]|nr:MAG: aminopeptidase N [Hyphomicrobiales bacterium]